MSLKGSAVHAFFGVLGACVLGTTARLELERKLSGGSQYFLAASRVVLLRKRIIRQEAIASSRMYNETVLEHFQNPRNVGEIQGADGVGIYMSDFCGDITKFWIKVVEGKIVDARYRTQGCAASVACGSVLTELVKDRTIEEALRITKDEIVSTLNGLPERKIHCSVLADDALKDAIRDYLFRNSLPVPQELLEKYERMKPLLEEMRRRGYILI